MTKYRRHFRGLAMLAVLCGLTFIAWSDAGDGREPNIPAESQEPNAPAEGSKPTDQRQALESTVPVGGRGLPGPAGGQEPTNPSYSWDTYKIVVERNMFSRQRGPRVERTRRQVPVAPPAPDPESYVVLKGIVQEDGAFIAFLEDTQSGQILRVRQGDSVLRGKIKALTLDSIEYEYADKTTNVTMGLNLQGGQAGTTLTGMYELTRTSPTTPAAGTTESSTLSSEDEAEILRQLMQRRQQQVGQ